MTKNVFKMAMALAMLFVTTQPANAQLGKLLKKIGNTVEADAGKYDITKRIMTLEYCKMSIRRCIRKEAPILWLMTMD